MRAPYLLGMAPRGSSLCVSWIRTFWKSTNLDLFTSSMKRDRFAHAGFRQIVGCNDKSTVLTNQAGKQICATVGLSRQEEFQRNIFKVRFT